MINLEGPESTILQPDPSRAAVPRRHGYQVHAGGVVSKPPPGMADRIDVGDNGDSAGRAEIATSDPGSTARDHAIQVHERKLEPACARAVLMVGSRFVTRYTEDAGFLLANLGAETTGIPGAVVWIAAGEFSEDEAHLGPRIVVVTGTELSIQSLRRGVAVAVDRPAHLLEMVPEAIRHQVQVFAHMNREVLLAYWRGELHTRSAIERLQRVRSS